MTGSVALVTPSYAGDLRRCEILCESVDRFVTGTQHHYILVDPQDLEGFAHLAGHHRSIIDERDILPGWLHRWTQPGGRRLWWSTRTWPVRNLLSGGPLRGWHVQQLRRIAVCAAVEADAFLYCDSDMMFVRPFDAGTLWNGDDLRLYRIPDGVGSHLPEGGMLHQSWTRHAARLLGLPAPTFPASDYINNLVSWRRDHVEAIVALIEARTGRHWVEAVASQATFSECQIYGAYADGVAKGEGHWHADFGLARTYWSGDALDAEGVGAFVAGLEEGQVAVGLQSFTNTDPKLLRSLLR